MSTEILEFKTEIKQLLDLMVHSLYSHKEVFYGNSFPTPLTLLTAPGMNL
jgi:hypothetical protein